MKSFISPSVPQDIIPNVPIFGIPPSAGTCGNYTNSYRVVFTSFSTKGTANIMEFFNNSVNASNYMVEALNGLSTKTSVCSVGTTADGVLSIPPYQSVLFNIKWFTPTSGYSPTINILDYNGPSGTNTFPGFVRLNTFVTVQLGNFPPKSTVYIQLIGQSEDEANGPSAALPYTV